MYFRADEVHQALFLFFALSKKFGVYDRTVVAGKLPLRYTVYGGAI